VRCTHEIRQFPLAPLSPLAKVIAHFHPSAAAVFPPSRRGKARSGATTARFNQKYF
jgi:hypothetical protein